jgi:hypothetical protein
MTGGTSRLAGFLGGLWGLALTTATIVAAPFIASLFEAGDAADEANNKNLGSPMQCGACHPAMKRLARRFRITTPSSSAPAMARIT